jgi:hypothetical protein
MRNPSSSDTNWPTEQILRTMAKLPPHQLTDVSFGQDILSSFESLGTTISDHILKEIAEIPKIPCLPPPAECSLEISNKISIRQSTWNGDSLN